MRGSRERFGHDATREPTTAPAAAWRAMAAAVAAALSYRGSIIPTPGPIGRSNIQNAISISVHMIVKAME